MVEAFHLVHHEPSGLYWNTASAILMLVLGTVELTIGLMAYLPERLRRPFRIEGREDLANPYEWFAVTVLLGITALAFGVGFFLRDFGYFLIMAAVTFGYWLLRVRPSRKRLDRDGSKSG